MDEVLNKSLKNRDYIINSVREELIGPIRIRSNFSSFNPIGSTLFESKEELYKPYYWVVGGVKEEILQRERPTQRYVSGMLFPLGVETDEEVNLERMLVRDDNEAESKQMNKKDNTLQNSVEKDVDIEATEDDGDIELFPQKNTFMPSSIGLTFCTDKNVDRLQVKVSGGTYKPHQVRVQGHSTAYTWWLREGIEGSIEISLYELRAKHQMEWKVELFNKKKEKATQFNVQVQARCREINDLNIITISLTNRSELNTMERDRLILFQSEMSVETLDDCSFSLYPKQHQMKKMMSDDDASIELLYRKEGIYALGHGCAVDWIQNEEHVHIIRTTFIPEYETISMTPDIETKDGKIKIKMADLAGLSSDKHPKELLQPIVEGYRNWIIEKESSIKDLPYELSIVAWKHMELCRESLTRIEEGLKLLDIPRVLKAFRLANLAILLQQENGKEKRQGRVIDHSIEFNKGIDQVVKNEEVLKHATNTWRAFQIAFILLSIEPLVNEKSLNRETVDLIWFPTGGGKTEAYLGVAAFQMLFRRLTNPLDTGTDIIMRYTLRLLTADQFQRSSRLICALEYIRKNNEKDLGEVPFSIGIWVGSSTSPNKNSVASIMLKDLEKNKSDAKGFLVHNCPWCGAPLGYYSQKGTKIALHFGYKYENERLIIHCPDKACSFHDELPIYIVDETIYEKRPTFLIGTVDKFVQLVWEPRARSLFGIEKDGNRLVSPPSLIIQDELHLISGPLGTLTGLFETLVEELCLKENDGLIIKPKIIAATATIKQFEEQALALYGRKKSRLFPSPGLEYDDSFFSKPARDTSGRLMPGRKYVGVYTTTVGIMMSQVMVYSSLIQAGKELCEDERDPYWTLLAFYNTLRELGGALTLTQTDIPQYSKASDYRKGSGSIRFLQNVLELTSRKQSHEISKIIDDLKVAYNKDSKKQATIDLCLASNIIEVGVDIDRLSVMAIVGQPKMTAQYIQVSGRVGRRWWERPGVIFTLYSNTKSRDRSHFEHFREYHQRLYASVEPTSVTPFSQASLIRGLHAVIVGYLRQALTDDIARSPDWVEIEKFLRSKVLPFRDRILERAKLVDLEQVEDLKVMFRRVLKNLENGQFTAWKVDPEEDGYMYPSGSNISLNEKGGAVSMMNSMRNVDAECRGQFTRIYLDEYKNTESDWEADFK